ncbi:MAG: hypothetical protein IPG66_17045 [Hydrogenophilales bacterium]|nr:hypothetical protein [Hydrogenophilales bacterium]
MGWSVTYDKSLAGLIEELTKTETQSDGSGWECLRHATVGNVLWTVWEVTPATPVPPKAYRPPYRFIGCHLLAPGGKGFGWGYKGMDESVGPVYYTCPLAYLDLVPVASAAWREQVRAWHAARNRKVEVGDVLILEGFAIPQLKIVEKQGRRLTGEYQGQLYRVPPRVLARVVEQRKAA